MRLKVHKELFATIQTKQNNGYIEKGAQMNEEIVTQATHTVAGGQEGQTKLMQQIYDEIRGEIHTRHYNHHNVVQQETRLQLLTVKRYQANGLVLKKIMNIYVLYLYSKLQLI